MKQREGYLVVDHSASPGLPADVARKAGYDPELVKGGKKLETPTLTCTHCRSVVVKSRFRVERASCAKCGGRYICDYCDWRSRQFGYEHYPYEKFADVTRELGTRGLAVRSYSHLIYGNPNAVTPMKEPSP